MKSILAKTPDNTITLSITIPKEEVAKTREIVVTDLAKAANVPGFRKGKAPKKLVEDKLDPAKVREEILKILLPKFYVEAIKEHNLNPIIHPHVHVEKIEDNADWQFSAVTCEKPTVDLKSYKTAVKNVTAKSLPAGRQGKIVIPGKEPKEPSFDEIVKAVLDSISITLPKVLIDQEADKSLSQLLAEVKKLGLTLDQYLSSTNRKPEDLRAEYEQKAQQDIKFEFALAQIAEEEKISVEEKEIDEAIAKAKTDEERKNLGENRYLLASILRQQKTLDFLKGL